MLYSRRSYLYVVLKSQYTGRQLSWKLDTRVHREADIVENGHEGISFKI